MPIFQALLYAVSETVMGFGWSLVWSTPLHAPVVEWLFFTGMLLSIYGKLAALTNWNTVGGPD